MGRPEQPLTRDGTPIRELAFWLRDLRNRTGLTYSQLARRSSYSTSTLQEATSGRRLPTLSVTLAIVRACGGNESDWRPYWSQIKRLVDHDLPRGGSGPVDPPWIERAGPGVHQPAGLSDGWYAASFKALVRLDVDRAEATEQRTIVATNDGLSEIDISISIPRHSEDDSPTHGLEVELLHGGALGLQEHPHESFFRNVVTLPEPLKAGDRHEYAVRMRIPEGQPMATHYVFVPLRRCDYFELRIRFDVYKLPRVVWELSGVPTAVIYGRIPHARHSTVAGGPRHLQGAPARAAARQVLRRRDLARRDRVPR